MRIIDDLKQERRILWSRRGGGEMFDLRIHSAAEAGPRVGGRSARREWHKWADISGWVGYLGV